MELGSVGEHWFADHARLAGRGVEGGQGNGMDKNVPVMSSQDNRSTPKAEGVLLLVEVFRSLSSGNLRGCRGNQSAGWKASTSSRRSLHPRKDRGIPPAVPG